jgi:CheY-like chemotaxis protein
MVAEKILVVEDERLVAEDLRDMLGNAGYDVVGVVSNGERAVEAVVDLNPDLVLMDVHLGSGMDGVTAADIIGSRSDVPVVYLTAYSNDATLVRARGTGAFGFVLKPFHEKAVIAAVEVALGRHGRETSRNRKEQILRKGFMTLPVGVIMADPLGNVVFANNLARTHMGRDFEEAGNPVPLSSVFKATGMQVGETSGEMVDRKAKIVEMSGKTLEVTYFEEQLRAGDGTGLGSIFVYQDAVHPVVPGRLGMILREFMKSSGDNPLGPAQFITVCAWSNKVKVSDDCWVSFEEFLMHYLGLQVSHGMSPEVAKTWSAGAT